MTKKEKFLEVIESIINGQKQQAVDQCVEFELTADDLIELAQETENDSPEMLMSLIRLAEKAAYAREVTLWENALKNL